MSSRTKKDIIFGNVEIDDSEFDPRKVKVRITTMVDEDIILTLKKIAKLKGHKYQTLLNYILRSYLEQDSSKKVKPLTEDRVRLIIKEELKKRA